MSSRQEHERLRNRRAGLGVWALPVAAVGGWLAYSHLYAAHDVPLPPAIQADRTMFSTERSGRLHVYHQRQAGGRPLVLLHSAHWVSSPYQMRSLFHAYAGERSVWALDLPGFGFSSRKARSYTPELYANAILDLLTFMGNEPADVVALSVSSEFASMAALERPDAFHSLTLISPTGLGSRGELMQQIPAGDLAELCNVAQRVVHVPLISRPLYDLLTLRSNVEWFLRRRLAGPLDTALVDYAYATAHQKGAHYAPLSYLSGKLFNPTVMQDIYAQLDVPVQVIYDRDPATGFEDLLEFVEDHANWRVDRIAPSAGLPQIDALADTMQALNRFWAKPGGLNS